MKHRRILAAAFAVALVGAVSGATAQPTAAASCSSLNEGQTLKLTGTIKVSEYNEFYNGGGKPTYSAHTSTTTFGIGTVTYTITACKDGTWRFISSPSSKATYVNLDSNLHVTGGAGRGWATVGRQVNGTSIVVEPTQCDRSWIWDGVKAVVSLPVPGLSYAVSVGKWLLGKAIPSDTDSCTVLGTMTLPVTFSSTGVPKVTSKTVNLYMKHEIAPQTTNGSAWHVLEYNVTVK